MMGRAVTHDVLGLEIEDNHMFIVVEPLLPIHSPPSPSVSPQRKPDSIMDMARRPADRLLSNAEEGFSDIFYVPVKVENALAPAFMAGVAVRTVIRPK
ncbi:hypothetical protein EBR66_06500 [bacterium]|nr:hypothetical protein [bacterium]